MHALAKAVRANELLEIRSRPSERSGLVAVTLGTTLSIQLFGIATGVLAARLLGVDDRGLLATVLLVAWVVGYVGELGLPTAYVYQAARHPSSLPALVGNAVVVSVVQTICLVALGVAAAMLALGRFGGEVVATGIAYVALFVPLSLLARYANGLNRGTHALVRFNMSRIAVPATTLAVLVGLAAVDHVTVRTAVAAALCGNVVSLVVAAGPWMTRTQWLRSSRFELPILRTTIRIGARAHVGALAPLDTMKLDLLLVALVLGAHDAGLYAVALAAAFVVRAQGTTLGLVALPVIARSAVKAARCDAGARFFRLALALNLATAGVVLLALPYVLPFLYGDEFAGAVDVGRVLVVTMVVASLRQVLGDCLRGAGRPLASTVAEVTSWPVAVGGFVILVPPFGAIGAALGAGISYVVSLAVAVALASRAGFSLRKMFLPQRDDVRAIASAMLRFDNFRHRPAQAPSAMETR